MRMSGGPLPRVGIDAPKDREGTRRSLKELLLHRLGIPRPPVLGVLDIRRPEC